MAVTLIDPEGRPVTGVYRHVAIGSGSRIVYIAGQVGWDAEGVTVSSDLADQVERSFLNVAIALAAAGATYDDVVKMTVHVVDWTPEKMPALMAGIERAQARLGVQAKPPTTLLGVPTLDVPEHLVEIEAVAVID